MNSDRVKHELKEIAHNMGGHLFGVCRIDDLRETFHFEIRETSKSLNTGISIGVPLSAGVLNTIIDRPNMLYKAHYQQVNHVLNDIAFWISSKLQLSGAEAIPIPASQILKWKPLRAHLSHREIAVRAGLGWYGRNNLLVTENYGSQVRLVTILTDLELEPDQPLDMNCGSCYACLDICPAGAIGENREDFNLEACYGKIQEFSRHNNYGHLICGLCLKHCPGKD